MRRRGETLTADRPGVPGVFLEGEAQESDLLAGDRVEETVDDPAGKTPSLVLVHVDHLKDNKSNTETQDF